MVRRGWRSATVASGLSAAIALTVIIVSSRSPEPSDLLAQISDESGIPTLRVGGRGRALKTSLVNLLGRLHATRRGQGSGEHGATRMGKLSFEKYAYENHQVSIFVF